MNKLSIVVIIKNRTNFPVTYKTKHLNLKLFEKNLDQLIKLHNPDTEQWELVVVDFKSTDVDMSTFLQSKFSNVPPSFTFKLHTMPDLQFCKGKGLNVAATIATHDWLFYLDADMLITDRTLFDFGYKYLLDSKVFFPICITYLNPEHTKSKPRPSGTGNVFIGKQNIKLFKWPEYKQWGMEDTNYYRFFLSKKLAVRELIKTFFHQWHPNDRKWKNRFYLTFEKS